MKKGLLVILKEFLFGESAPVYEKEPEPCQGCEMLKEQLAFANYDRKMLLEHFVRAAMPDKKEENPIDVANLAPIRTIGKPWKVRQQELELESRQRAEMLRPKPRTDAPRTVTQESIEQLEKELGVTNANGPVVQEANGSEGRSSS